MDSNDIKEIRVILTMNTEPLIKAFQEFAEMIQKMAAEISQNVGPIFEIFQKIENYCYTEYHQIRKFVESKYPPREHIDQYHVFGYQSRKGIYLVRKAVLI